MWVCEEEEFSDLFIMILEASVQHFKAMKLYIKVSFEQCENGETLEAKEGEERGN